ncbi:MAG: response regulator [Candidatus Niyogibacteria bacterium]|nr:response regulator [Candidatus Niyogibacteria bacterium]
MQTKVLVIEDDQLMAGLLAEKLAKSDFDVRLAADGEAGMKELENPPAGGLPDIILLDLILPGVSGFEILAKIKEDERTKAIPVVILSNLGSREEVEKGLKLGAESYLIKANVLIDEVVKKIRDTVAKKQLP